MIDPINSGYLYNPYSPTINSTYANNIANFSSDFSGMFGNLYTELAQNYETNQNIGQSYNNMNNAETQFYSLMNTLNQSVSSLGGLSGAFDQRVATSNNPNLTLDALDGAAIGNVSIGGSEILQSAFFNPTGTYSGNTSEAYNATYGSASTSGSFNLTSGETNATMLQQVVNDINGTLATPQFSNGSNYASSAFYVDPEGNVYATGNNQYGQLGIGSTTNASALTQVSGLSDVIQAESGANTGYFLTKNGSVYASGYSGDGEFGNGSATGSTTPTLISNLSNITQIAAGEASGYAVNNSGVLYAWGENQDGQLGNGNTTGQATATEVMTGVQSVAAMSLNSVVLKSNGTVWVAGDNTYGQLGNGTTGGSSSTYVQVAGLSNIKQIAVSGDSIFALTNTGSVYSWGYNQYGDTGTGTGGSPVTTPTMISGLSNVTSLSGTGDGAYALTSSGQVYAWGYGGGGALGQGTTNTNAVSPVLVPGLSNITAVGSVEDGGYAVSSNGQIYSWGTNTNGDLAEGSATTSASPVTITSPMSTTTPTSGEYSAKIVTNSSGQEAIQITGPAAESISFSDQSGSNLMSTLGFSVFQNISSSGVNGVADNGGLLYDGAGATSSTVTVSANASAVMNAVNNFVYDYNNLISNLEQSSQYYNPNALSQLIGNSQALSSQLSQIGITVGSDGTLSVNNSQFNSAISNNFNEVNNLFNGTNGLATTVQSLTTNTMGSFYGSNVSQNYQNSHVLPQGVSANLFVRAYMNTMLYSNLSSSPGANQY